MSRFSKEGKATQQELTDNQLQALVEETSLTFFKKSFQHKAFFNRRLRTTGGRYHLSSHNIDFNPKVFELYGESELLNVIKHELCHYHLHLEGRGYQHKDAEFKALLKQTGGSRYVRPLAEQKPQSYHQYQCEKCQTLILRKRRINTQRFVCGKCQGKLVELN
ncbi:SprT-like protein [Enterococcus moraviensis ATCC BAA-383]|uniref:Protein SprT-like n=1 Tax=Enterococcus moraviensis ATCC BAA-383 TaxID=1158609 RepID=R2TA56_9ENTE|nr:SprT family protein [Enterococcus moraviensis]EOI01919.1 SprT-like protein [Enterococcus moraviensis ATCC BAA-383]EOT73546.1 SprT-like protein [Enterococcus moraviensis ATCC BAA-383]OJG69106.1 SprT-like protein [Enterococcus moraviensis]